MCGIAGIVSSKIPDQNELGRILRRMGLWQFHRGPDDWGEWIEDGVALGNNRLAILDIEGGKQPMASADGLIHVVFNGEIYNFYGIRRELERNGHSFKSDHSDTETIVLGYREWGVRVFEKLEGMFAIAIWDREQHSLILARDRVGIKPLYFAELPGEGIVFASEPKAILATGLIERDMNSVGLVDYFLFRGQRHPHTMIRGIRKVPPGSWCLYRPGTGIRNPKTYWEPRIRRHSLCSLEETEERILSEIRSAAASQVVADVPVGIYLSGGVDSSLLTATISQETKLEAFTITTDSPLDETRYARFVANRFKIDLHTRRVTADDFFDRIEDWLYFNDDPVSDPSALALMILSEHARASGMKVMLAGEGADEIFGGYNSYRRYALMKAVAAIPFMASIGRMISRGSESKISDYLRSLGGLRFWGTAHITSFYARRRLFSPDAHDIIERMENDVVSRAPANVQGLREAMLFDQQVRLPNDILPRTDRASMATSVEVRVPYLNHNVIELANGLPDELCVRGRRYETKWILKRLLARFLPRDMVYRSKVGFDLPIGEWIQTRFDEKIRHYIAQRQLDGINYKYIQQLYSGRGGGRSRHAPLLWAWLVMEEWYRLWMGGAAVLNSRAKNMNAPLYLKLQKYQ